jgi:hypothetical protein
MLFIDKYFSSFYSRLSIFRSLKSYFFAGEIKNFPLPFAQNRSRKQLPAPLILYASTE